MSGGYGSTLTVVRQARDDDGDHAGPTVEVVTTGWEIAPAGSTEQTGAGRDGAVTVLECYGGPRGVDIRPDDRVYLDADVRVDGRGRPVPPPWQVQGQPDRWGGPRSTWDPGSVVRLRRVSAPNRSRGS